MDNKPSAEEFAKAFLTKAEPLFDAVHGLFEAVAQQIQEFVKAVEVAIRRLKLYFRLKSKRCHIIKNNAWKLAAASPTWLLPKLE